tara:strand:- start:289 stop:498 length:210 start_codon:yes stop_codon:yes gene_type:complete
MATTSPLVVCREYMEENGVPETQEDLLGRSRLRFWINPGGSHWELENMEPGKLPISLSKEVCNIFTSKR